jgi:hypothetical protein
MGRNQEALEVFDRVIELEPASVLARKGRAVSLMRLSRPAAAARAFEWLAHRGVRDPSVLTAYSLCLGDAGRHPEALRMIERALSYAPEDPGLKLQRSLLLLTFGRYADALPLYEYRHQSAFFNEAERRVFTEGPRWTGDESPAGRRILLRAEQGLGDSFHFVRYAIELERRGAAVIVQVPADLVGFFSESLPRLRFIARGEALPEYDLHCPLMSLPLAFLRMDHTMQFFSSAEAYLRASPERMAEWSSRLSSHGSGPRVGITWQGRRTHRTDAARSIPLAQMLDALPAGIQYVCLQNELTDSERELLAHRSDILSFTDQLTDWSQTAALCAQMDRIVSIDTSVAHLGAALGRPVDLLLSRAPDWRWQLTGSSTDWYPTMTLHRQASLGDWSVPLAELRRALSSLARCD